jgi:hypothetical protein
MGCDNAVTCNHDTVHEIEYLCVCFDEKDMSTLPTVRKIYDERRILSSK